jgi:hypothetical protein
MASKGSVREKAYSGTKADRAGCNGQLDLEARFKDPPGQFKPVDLCRQKTGRKLPVDGWLLAEPGFACVDSMSFGQALSKPRPDTARRLGPPSRHHHGSIRSFVPS